MSASNTNLVRKLLNRAWEDVEAAESLYSKGLRHSALYHLEQASEKALKAYFIGFLITPLKFIYELGEEARAFEVSRKIHQLLAKAVKHYAKPKSLGHKFTRFLNEFLLKLYEGYCGGDFAKYVDCSIKRALIPLINKRKQTFIAKLVATGLPEDRAKSVLEAIVEVITQIPGTIKSEELQKKLYSGSRGSLKNFVDVLEEIIKSKGPCLHLAIERYRSVDDVLTKYIEEIKKKLELPSTMDQAKKLLIEIADYLGIKFLKDMKVDAPISNYIRGNMLVFMVLPLHSCLAKYHDLARYPEDNIPEEEFNAIPEVLTLVKEVHNTVKSLVELMEQAYH